MKYEDESIQKLMKAITGITSVEECAAFFDDLCTIKELQDMAQRFETAILLKKGNASYQKISAEVGASTATISRVSKCLNYGSGGYRSVLDRMEKEGN